MTKFEILLDKINAAFEAESTNDFHSIFIMLDCALIGRISNYYKNEIIISDYFTYSPEVFDIVKEYPVKKLMKFLEKVIKINITRS